MTNRIFYLFCVLFLSFGLSAQDDPGTTKTQLVASVTIGSANASGSEYVTLSQFNDISGVPVPYTATDVVVGIKMWDGKCDRYQITEVVSTTPFLEVKVAPLNSNEPFVAPTTGIGVIFEDTPNRGYPLENVGIPEKIERCMTNHFRLMLDEDLDEVGTSQVLAQTDNTVTLSEGGGTITVDDGDSDPTNEIQSANAVPITDAAGNYTATDVEGALAEISSNVAADGDTDSSNEIQTLALNSNELSISGGNTVTLPPDGDSDSTNEIQDAGAVDIADTGGNYTATDVEGALAEIATTVAADGDTDSSNEIQTITRTGLDVELSNGGGTVNVADNDNDPLNEIQDAGGVDIADSGNNYTSTNVEGALAEIATTVAADGDTDSSNEIQTLSNNVTGLDNVIALDNGGGSVTVNVADNDNDPLNEIQDASGVDIADAGNNYTSTSVEGALAEIATTVAADNDQDPANEIQTISRTGLDVQLSNGGGTVNVADNDNDSSNETVSAFSVSGGEDLRLTEAGVNFTVDGFEFDNQTLAYNSSNNELSIADGNIVTLNPNDADSDPANEIQAITRTGLDVELSNGGGTVSVADNDNDPLNEIQDAGAVDIADGGNNYTSTNVEGALAEIGTSLAADTDQDPTNEIQTISNNVTGLDNVIALDNGGGSVTVNVADNDNDSSNESVTAFEAVNGNLTMTESGNTWAIAEGGFDNQELTLSTTGTLSIDDGNSVDLTSVFPEFIEVTFAADGVVMEAYGLAADVAQITYSRLGNNAEVVIPLDVNVLWIKTNIDSGDNGGSADYNLKVIDRNGGKNTTAENFVVPTHTFMDRDNLNTVPPTATLPYRNRADNAPTPAMWVTGFGTDAGGGSFITVTLKGVDSYGLSTSKFAGW